VVTAMALEGMTKEDLEGLKSRIANEVV
jgi:hypothetical protein